MSLNMSRIERRYCFLNTSYMTGLFVIFINYFIFDKIMCELLSMRTLCDAYHEERVSHLRSILDISPLCISKSIQAGVYIHLRFSAWSATLRFWNGLEKLTFTMCICLYVCKTVRLYGVN